MFRAGDCDKILQVFNMRRSGVKVRRVLLIFFLWVCWHPALYAIMGAHDAREYVSAEEWAKPPYDNIVRLNIYKSLYRTSICTGQYVGDDLILTAYHCVESVIGGPKIDADIYTATNEFKRVGLSVVKSGNWNRLTSNRPEVTAQDWVLLRIPAGHEAIKSGGGFDVSGTVVNGMDGENWGFGSLRVIKDSELPEIKAVVTDEIEKVCTNSAGLHVSYDLMVESGHGYGDVSYVTNCLGGALGGINKKLGTPLTTSKETSRLKKSRCKILDTRLGSLITDCDTYNGNSGGPFFVGNNLYGVVSNSSYGFTDTRDSGFSAVDMWRNEVLGARSVKSATDTKAQPLQAAQTDKTTDNATNAIAAAQAEPKATPEQVTAEVAALEQELKNVGDDLLDDVDRLKSMDDTEFIRFLDGMTEYSRLEEEYKKAKERETSLGNRILGAAAIGVTGMGLSELMSSAAEQKADARAEAEMKAYLATFHCNYGDGKNVAGGAKEVQLPGGNELVSLYAEYVNLANDLKARKSALDMRPGIESESILDSVVSGLYDDVALGKTEGAFTSLARALMEPGGKDAQEWAAQKAQSAKDKNTGTALSATGALGGLTGNLIINKDSNKQEQK